MTNTFGFVLKANKKLEEMKAEAAKVAEAAKCLQSIRKDLGIKKSDYLDFIDRPMTDEQFRNIAERQISDLQDTCSHSQFLQELGLQQYINELNDVYQSALKLESGNPNLDPMPCIGYIESLLNSEETIEHIEGFGRELCNSMYRAIIIMAFEIEISNVESLVKDHQAEQFHNFMETKVAELDQQEEHMSYML